LGDAEKANKELPGGETLVDAEDGSAWKIVLDAQTVSGLQNRFTAPKNEVSTW
jgi:hypothetical protein